MAKSDLLGRFLTRQDFDRHFEGLVYNDPQWSYYDWVIPWPQWGVILNIPLGIASRLTEEVSNACDTGKTE